MIKAVKKVLVCALSSVLMLGTLASAAATEPNYIS